MCAIVVSSYCQLTDFLCRMNSVVGLCKIYAKLTAKVVESRRRPHNRRLGSLEVICGQAALMRLLRPGRHSAVSTAPVGKPIATFGRTVCSAATGVALAAFRSMPLRCASVADALRHVSLKLCIYRLDQSGFCRCCCCCCGWPGHTPRWRYGWLQRCMLTGTGREGAQSRFHRRR